MVFWVSFKWFLTTVIIQRLLTIVVMRLTVWVTLPVRLLRG